MCPAGGPLTNAQGWGDAQAQQVLVQQEECQEQAVIGPEAGDGLPASAGKDGHQPAAVQDDHEVHALPDHIHSRQEADLGVAERKGVARVRTQRASGSGGVGPPSSTSGQPWGAEGVVPRMGAAAQATLPGGAERLNMSPCWGNQGGGPAAELSPSPSLPPAGAPSPDGLHTPPPHLLKPFLSKGPTDGGKDPCG